MLTHTIKLTLKLVVVRRVDKRSGEEVVFKCIKIK